MKIHNEESLKEFFKHEKKNIAIFTDIFYPSLGGVTFVVDNLAKTLQKRNNYNVVVITGNVKNYTDNTPYPVVRTKSIPIPKYMGDSLPTPKFDSKFKKLLKNLNLDLVHIQTVFGICTYGIKFAKNNNIPIIYHGHSKFNEEYYSITNSKLISAILAKRAFKIVKKANLVLTVSNNTKDIYLQQGVKNHIEVLSNATEMTPQDNREKAFNYIKQKHNINLSQKNILVLVSRMEIKTKNIDFLLKSLKVLKDKNIDFTLLMVGNGKDYNEIKKLVKNLNLENNVIMVGAVRDRTILSYYYKRADLNVFPSVVDNCPLIKFEAATQETPTLAVKNTGASEEIIDNFNGFLAENNVESYANRLIEVLNDYNKLKEISQNASKTLSKSWDNVTEIIENYYLNLINK